VFNILENNYGYQIDSDTSKYDIWLSNGSRYYPDLIDHVNGVIYEIKSEYTYSIGIDKLKMCFDSVTDLGFKYIVCIFKNDFICFISDKSHII